MKTSFLIIFTLLGMYSAQISFAVIIIGGPGNYDDQTAVFVVSGFTKECIQNTALTTLYCSNQIETLNAFEV
jgi:hypothetical protein